MSALCESHQRGWEEGCLMTGHLESNLYSTIAVLYSAVDLPLRALEWTFAPTHCGCHWWSPFRGDYDMIPGFLVLCIGLRKNVLDFATPFCMCLINLCSDILLPFFTACAGLTNTREKDTVCSACFSTCHTTIFLRPLRLCLPPFIFSPFL